MTGGNAARRILGGIVLAAAAGLAWWSFHHAQARQHWQQAEAALKRQDPEAAREHLSQCLRWGDDRLEVRLLAARAARLTGRLDEAEEHLAYCESHAERGRAHADLLTERALLQVRQGDLTGNLKQVAPRGPNDPDLSPEVLETLAFGFSETFYGNSALFCLRTLIQEYPEDGRGRLLAGEILTHMRQYKEAAEQFEQAVRCFPQAPAPRRRLAECLLELGEAREAATHLDALRLLHPDDADTLFALAKIKVYRGQVDQAKQLLAQALAKDPGHVPALVERGRLEYRHGDPRQALAWFRRAAEARPAELEAWEGLVHCYDAVAQPDEAANSREEVTRLMGEFGAITRLELQAMHEKAGDVALTIELADRYERLHLPEKALGWRFRTLQLDPRHRPTHEALAEYFERGGQPHRAARHRALAGS